jgi:hypothetical protein
MVAELPVEIGAAGIAAAIGEPARARILYCLLDGTHEPARSWRSSGK